MHTHNRVDGRVQFHQMHPLSVQNNYRLRAMMGTVLADTAHKELFDAALVVFGHDYSWSLQIMSSDTYDLTNGVLVSVEVCDLNLMRDLL